MDDDAWGYAIYDDGTRVPLKEPDGLIPEEDREYLIRTPKITLWTKRPSP